MAYKNVIAAKYILQEPASKEPQGFNLGTKKDCLISCILFISDKNLRIFVCSKLFLLYSYQFQVVHYITLHGCKMLKLFNNILECLSESQ